MQKCLNSLALGSKKFFYLGYAVMLWLLSQTLQAPFAFKPFIVCFIGCGIGFVALYFNAQRWTFSRLELCSVSFFFGALLYQPTFVLSDDAIRYLWDGGVLLNGFLPTNLTPSSEVLKPLLQHFQWTVPHAQVESIYPLISQVYFGLLSLCYANPAVFLIAAMGLNVLTTFVLCEVCQVQNLPLNRVALFAFHPTLLLESGASGHLESLGLLGVALLMLCFAKQKPLGALWASAVGLIKLWPVVFVLYFSKSKKMVLAASCVFGLGFLITFPSMDHAQGLTTYVSQWEFHGPLYALLKGVCSKELLRFGLMGGFLVCCVWFVWVDPAKRCGFYLVFAFLFFSPTVYPWYALWGLPFVVIRPTFEKCYFIFSLVFSYEVLETFSKTGVWKASNGSMILSFGVTCALLILRHSNVYLSDHRAMLKKQTP